MRRRCSLAFALLFLTSCPATVVDPLVIEELTALQPAIDSVLAELQQTAGTPQADYQHHVQFYTTTRAELAALRGRVVAADARTLSMIEQVLSNVDRLEEAHRKGISGAEVPTLRRIFSAQFEAIRMAGEER